MKKKEKKTEQQIQAEREERISAASDKMQTQLLKIEKMKQTYVRKAAEADQKGLTQQKQTAVNLLRKCMTLEKQVNGMIMSMELAVQAKELSSLTSTFMQCMCDISDDITVDNKNTDLKKTQNKFMHAMFAQKQQEEKLNEMLDTGNYALINDGQSDEVSEFDDEIDSLIAAASEDMNMSSAGVNSYKNRR